jgi:hypothetical protein
MMLVMLQLHQCLHLEQEASNLDEEDAQLRKWWSTVTTRVAGGTTSLLAGRDHR